MNDKEFNRIEVKENLEDGFYLKNATKKVLYNKDSGINYRNYDFFKQDSQFGKDNILYIELNFE